MHTHTVYGCIFYDVTVDVLCSQIVSIIDDNEDQFLSSLQQGVRIINKTAPLSSNHNSQPLFPGEVSNCSLAVTLTVLQEPVIQS